MAFYNIENKRTCQKYLLYVAKNYTAHPQKSKKLTALIEIHICSI